MITVQLRPLVVMPLAEQMVWGSHGPALLPQDPVVA